MLDHDHPLWADPARPHGPPLTPDAVRRFERRSGLVLPRALVEALAICNGGRLRRAWLPDPTPSPRWSQGVLLHGLAGVGYDEGLDWSPALTDEWGFPSPGLVLCHGGPWAVLLDYRRCGPQGQPPVLLVDTDHEVAGRPAEWTLAPDIETLLAALVPVAERTAVALEGALDEGEVLDLCRRLGGEDPVRRDYEGGLSLTVPGPDSTEPGVARLRALPNLRPDRTLALPERPDCGWILETTVAAPALDPWLARLEEAVGGRALLLTRREA